MKYNKQTSFFILLALFGLSVLMRIPNLNRPLSKHHEFNAAMILNVCKSWKLSGGPASTNFAPIVFYGNETDKTYLNNVGIVNGKFYYVSMGPMQFLLPYYFFKITNLSITPLNLQIFSMLVHFLLILLFFKFCILFYGESKAFHKSIVTTIVFIFLHPFLWFFSNAFSHESLVLLFYVALAYHFYKIILKKKINQWHYGVIAIVAFCGIATDWLFVVIVGYFIAYFMITKTWRKEISVSLVTVIIASILSTFLIYFFYSKELGQSALWKIFKEKFFSRTINGSSEQYSTKDIMLDVFKNMLISYGVFILVTLFFFKKIKSVSVTQRNVLYFVGVPPLLYSLILIQFTAENDYSMLKFGFLMVLLLGLILFNLSEKKIWAKWFFVFATISQIATYFYINRPGAIALNGDSYNTIEVQGKYIHQHSNNDEIIVCSFQTYNYAALMYYASRNIVFLKTEEETYNYQKTNKFVKARYFYFDQSNQLNSKLLYNP